MSGADRSIATLRDFAVRTRKVDHEAGVHIARAAAMVESGAVGDAAMYLRTLAANALSVARVLEREAHCSSYATAVLDSTFSAFGKNRQRGVAYWRALRMVVSLGVPSTWPLEVAMPPAEVLDLDVRPDDDAHPASYAREVPNPHWPELNAHGVFVDVYAYRPQRGHYVVELQCLPPDEVRSQVVFRKVVTSREEAIARARAWVSLGERIIAVTRVVVAREKQRGSRRRAAA